MPETASTNDLVQVRVRGEIEGQETLNVLHFKAASDVDDIDLRLIVVLANCFVTHLIPVLSSKWTLKELIWKKVSPALGNEFVHVVASGNVGEGSANNLPSFNSALFSIRTAQGGKSHRGRMYIPGLPEDMTAGSSIDTNLALWAALVAFAACIASEFIDLGDPIPANSFAFGVYSRKLGGASFPYQLAGFTPATQVIPQSLIASTRSRKVGRGS